MQGLAYFPYLLRQKCFICNTSEVESLSTSISHERSPFSGCSHTLLTSINQGQC